MGALDCSDDAAFIDACEGQRVVVLILLPCVCTPCGLCAALNTAGLASNT